MAELERVGVVMARMLKNLVDPPLPEEELGREPSRYIIVRMDGSLTLVEVKKKGAIPLPPEVMTPWVRSRIHVQNTDYLD